MILLLFGCFIFFIIKINEFESMVWSLWIRYIPFAGTFEEKFNKYFPFENIYFLHRLPFIKIVPISEI